MGISGLGGKYVMDGIHKGTSGLFESGISQFTNRNYE